MTYWEIVFYFFVILLGLFLGFYFSFCIRSFVINKRKKDDYRQRMDEKLDRNTAKYRKKKEKRIEKKIKKEKKKLEKETELLNTNTEEPGEDVFSEEEPVSDDVAEEAKPEEDGILSKRIKDHESYVSVMCDINNEKKDTIVKNNIKTQDGKYAIKNKKSDQES